LDGVTNQNIEGVAALTPSGQTVIVLNNRDVATTYAVSIMNKQGAPLNLNLEPRSLTTVVYSD
jgi:O-glycosyl hydrolase